MRARARLTRSQSWRSKMRSTASVYLRYSPSSAVTKSISVGATRGMIEVPPPTRISKPLTPSRSRAMKATSWMPVSARSVVRARERRLDLARHQLRGGMAHEVADVGTGVGRRVEQLVVADAGPRIGGHVAHGVAAALAAREAGVGDLADQRRGVAQRHVVHLDVLPRRDVPLVEGDVLLDHVGERLHLLRRDAAERQLDADHLDVGLALAVDPLLETEADELGLGRLRRRGTSRTRCRSRRTRARGSG